MKTALENKAAYEQLTEDLASGAKISADVVLDVVLASLKDDVDRRIAEHALHCLADDGNPLACRE